MTEETDKILGWEKIVSAMPGDTILFGEYCQSSWVGDKQPIEWLVLEKEQEHLLVVSRQCLDCRRYNDTAEACTWESSSLRTWLNRDFIMGAFTVYERARIALTSVGAHENPEVDSAYVGNATEDKIFLLSAAEAEQYFKSAEERMAFPTKYALLMGAGFDHDIENGPCWWWLRTPGKDNSFAADVRSGGTVNFEGCKIDSANFSVRPALWIDVHEYQDGINGMDLSVVPESTCAGDIVPGDLGANSCRS